MAFTGAPLYKYLPIKHAVSLAKRGVIKIGTLSEFRAGEEIDEARRDVSEGVLERVADVDRAVWDNKNQPPDFIANFIRLEGEGSFAVSGMTFTEEYRHEDAYVFCMSDVMSDEILKGFAGTDACVRINSPAAFFDALTSALGSRVEAGVVDHCIYDSRRVDYWSPVGKHPCFIKDPRYEWQREVRAMWEPARRPIQPIIMRVPRLAALCSLIVP